MALEPDELAAASGDLGAALRELRRAAGLSGERLARRCSMSQSKISKIETGCLTPALVDLDRILAALEVSPEQAGLVLARARLANTEWQGERELSRTAAPKGRSATSARSRATLYEPVVLGAGTPRPAVYVRPTV